MFAASESIADRDPVPSIDRGGIFRSRFLCAIRWQTEILVKFERAVRSVCLKDSPERVEAVLKAVVAKACATAPEPSTLSTRLLLEDLTASIPRFTAKRAYVLAGSGCDFNLSFLHSKL